MRLKVNRVEELTSQLIDHELSPDDAAELDALLADDAARQAHFSLLAMEGRLRTLGAPPDVAVAAIDAIRQAHSVDLQRQVMREIAGGPLPAWRREVAPLWNEKSQLFEQRTRRRSPAAWRKHHVIAAVSLALLLALVGPWALRSWRSQREMATLAPVIISRSASVDIVDAQARTPASVGSTLPPGQSLHCATVESAAELRYPDGTRLQIHGPAQIHIERAGGGKRLRLEFGALRADVAPQPVGRPLVIATPHTSVRVLGTRFDLTASSHEGTRLDLESGRVTLERRGETPLEIQPNTVALVPPDASPVVLRPQQRLLTKPLREVQARDVSHVVYAKDGHPIIAATRWQAVYWGGDERLEMLPINDELGRGVSLQQATGTTWALRSEKDRRVLVWSAARRHLLASTPLDQGMVMAVSPRGDWLLVKGARDLNSNETVSEIFHFGDGRRAVIRAFNKGLCAAASPDGQLLAVGRDGVELIDPASGERLASLKPRSKPVNSKGGQMIVALAFSGDGSRIVGGMQGSLEVWDVATRQHLASLAQPGLRMSLVAVSTDGQRVAGAQHDRVYLWDAATQQELATIHVGERVRGMAFSPDAAELATTDSGGHIRVWNLQNLARPTE